MITEYITEHDILGRPYDPRQVIEREVGDHIEDLLNEYDGESLKSHLVDLCTAPKMLLREVLLELIEVSEIGLKEKLREDWTKEAFDALKHISSLIKMMPIEHEMNVLVNAFFCVQPGENLSIRKQN